MSVMHALALRCLPADVFLDWLKVWDRKLRGQGRKVLLFVDNCSAHPNVKLSNIALKFFLPNTAEAQVRFAPSED